MEILNATKRTIEVRFGKKGKEEPEISALIPVGASQDLPYGLEVMTIVDIKGKRGRKRKE